MLLAPEMRASPDFILDPSSARALWNWPDAFIQAETVVRTVTGYLCVAASLSCLMQRNTFNMVHFAITRELSIGSKQDLHAPHCAPLVSVNKLCLNSFSFSITHASAGLQIARDWTLWSWLYVSEWVLGFLFLVDVNYQNGWALITWSVHWVFWQKPIPFKGDRIGGLNGQEQRWQKKIHVLGRVDNCTTVERICGFRHLESRM